MDNLINCEKCKFTKISNYCSECYNKLNDAIEKKIKDKNKRREYDRKYYLNKKLKIKKIKNDDNLNFINISEGRFTLEL